jgi:hypothetical protein
MKSRVWVLDTETKGTGAQMVPLESVLAKPEPKREPLVAPSTRRPKAEPATEPGSRPPRSFKVVDISTREVLADGSDARRTLELLGGLRSSVDVSVHVWEPEDERWRLLTLGERKLLWERRRRPSGSAAAAAR